MSRVAVTAATNALSSASGAQLRTQLHSIIDKWPVVLFSKSWCNFSRESKVTLKALYPSFVVIELDDLKNEQAVQSALEEISTQRTVPNIYIGQDHIGGNSDLQKLVRAGKLNSLIEAAVEKLEKAKAKEASVENDENAEDVKL